MRPKKRINAEAGIRARFIVDDDTIALIACDRACGWKRETVGTKVVIDGTSFDRGVEEEGLLNGGLTYTDQTHGDMLDGARQLDGCLGAASIHGPSFIRVQIEARGPGR